MRPITRFRPHGDAHVLAERGQQSQINLFRTKGDQARQILIPMSGAIPRCIRRRLKLFLVPNWSRFGSMPVNLSIKNAPDEVVRHLRRRAERHHRSLQGELLAIIEEAARAEQALSPTELLAEIRDLGLRTRADSAAIVRTARDRT